MSAANSFPDLSTQWQDVEFNILGDCCGDQAVFNAGSTIDAHTEVDSGVTSAPTCAIEGFTAESNNLFLTNVRQMEEAAISLDRIHRDQR